MEENLLRENPLSQLKAKRYNMLVRIKTPVYPGFFFAPCLQLALANHPIQNNAGTVITLHYV